MLTTHNYKKITYKTRNGKSSHRCGKWRPWNALQSLNAIPLGNLAADLPSAIPVSCLSIPCTTRMYDYLQRGQSQSLSLSRITPDTRLVTLCPSIQISRYLDIQISRQIAREREINILLQLWSHSTAIYRWLVVSNQQYCKIHLKTCKICSKEFHIFANKSQFSLTC